MWSYKLSSGICHVYLWCYMAKLCQVTNSFPLVDLCCNPVKYHIPSGGSSLSSDKLFLWWISAVTLSSTTFPLVDPLCQAALYLLWWYPNKLLKPSYSGGYQIWICQGNTFFLWWMLLYKNVALVDATPSSDNIFALVDLHCQSDTILTLVDTEIWNLSLSSDKLWKHVLTKRFSTPSPGDRWEFLG